jgi:hypothetical protein
MLLSRMHKWCALLCVQPSSRRGPEGREGRSATSPAEELLRYVVHIKKNMWLLNITSYFQPPCECEQRDVSEV